MVRRVGAIACALLVIFVSQVVIPRATAQTQLGTGLTVIPPLKIYENIQPGTSVSDQIRIQNVDTRTHTIAVAARNFVSDAEGRGCVPTTNRTRYALAPWLKASPPTAVLVPNAQFTFNYTLTIPANADPGGKYGALVFQVVPDNVPPDASGVRNIIEGTTCFLVNVAGDVRYGATLAGFSAKIIKLKTTTQPKAQPGAEQAAVTKTVKDVHFTTRVQNTGNGQIQPTGQISITNIWGKKKPPIPIEPGQGSKYVLPGTTRIFENDWKDPPIGFYRAKVKVFYDSNHPILIGETTFWILPPIWIWLLLLALLLLLIWLWRSRKRIKRGLKAYRGEQVET